MNSKKIFSLLSPSSGPFPITGAARLLLYLTLFLQACASTQPKSLTILHTNDIHAAYIPHEAFWVRSTEKPMVGGFYELWWTVDSIRRAKGPLLLLDAGDLMTGTPVSELEYKGVTGGALSEMMNVTGYDLWTIGNHDLDISQDNLRQLISLQKFPTVSANLTDTIGGFPFGNKEYVILEKNGLRIGIIGLMAHDLFQLTNTNNLKGLKVLPPPEVTQRIIDKITGQTDLIIALTHEGVDEDSILAVSTHGLNVIIGGHSHTRLKTPKQINGVIICQTGSSCENLGELALTVEHHAVTAYDGKLLPLWARHPRIDNEMTRLIDDSKKKIDQDYAQQIGTLASDWKRSGSSESNIGDFIADAMRETAGAQVGVTNSSGIRSDLRAGPITKLSLFEILPFRNILCTFELSGAELRAFAQRYLESLVEHKSSIQLSGLTCSWKSVNGKPEIQHLKIGGEELSDGKRYTCATSDFVVNQAEKYLGFTPAKVSYLTATVFQALVAKVEKDKVVNSQVENRFSETQ
jgi:5'-nucleotidase / UDP-sugar diphosphatase